MAKLGLVGCRRDCHPWPFQPGHQGSPWWGECGSSPLLHERGPPPALGASLSLDRLPGDSTWRRAVTEEGRQRAWGGRARSGQRAQCWGLAWNPALLLNSCVTSVSQQTSLSLRWLSVGWITTPLCRLRSRDGLHVPCPEQGEKGYSAARQGDPGIGGHFVFLTHLGSACDHSTLLCSTAVGGGPHSCLPELLGAGVHRAFFPTPTGVWVPLGREDAQAGRLCPGSHSTAWQSQDWNRLSLWLPDAFLHLLPQGVCSRWVSPPTPARPMSKVQPCAPGGIHLVFPEPCHSSFLMHDPPDWEPHVGRCV